MRHMLSRDNLYDFAHQAVGAVRRIVSSSEAWGAREALSSVSQAVAVACRTNSPVEVTTLTAWAGDLVRELETYYSTPGSPVGTGAADAAATAAVVTGSNGAAKDEAAKPLSESALAANLEVARALVFTCNAEAAITAYRSNKLVAALVQFYCSAALTQKLRDCGANVVVGVCSSHALLVRDFMITCRDRLRGVPPNEHNSRVLQILLASLAVEVLHQFQLRSYGHLQTELDTETAENCTSLMDSLFDAAYTLTVHGNGCATANGSGGIAAATPHAASRTPSMDADAAASSRSPTPPPAAEPPNPSSAAASPASPLPATVSARMESDGAAAAGGSQGSVNLDITTAVVFLAVTAGVYRARPALKRYLVRHSGAEYAQVWVRAASQVSQMHTTLFLRQSSRSPVSATLEPVEYWRGELLEGLVELCTMDSFTVQRAMVMSAAAAAGQGALPAAPVSAAAAGGAARKGVSGAATAASAAGSPLQLPPSGSSAGAAAAATAARQLFEPVPADWETYLSSSSPAVWRLAAALFPCIITADGAEIFKAVLLPLNTRHLSAEALYRCTISTLTLLCAANPRNAVVLSEHDMLHTIIALVSCNQASVFPASQQVTLWSQRHGILNPMLNGATAGPGMPLEETLTLTPPSTLNVNTTQLTFSFLHSLTSIYFSKATVLLLLQGVRDMYATASAQTDVDVIENLLYGLGRAFIPHPLLFFPGDGYVSWRLKQMFPRGSGYTFTAWVFPTCVWVGGSCLYTFMDQYDTRVSVLIVADGRQCSLAVRVSKAGGEPAEVLLGGSSFTASTWTHLVINHGVAMNVYVNGQRLEPVHEVPYPKEKHSLLFSIGGAAQLPGFFGFVSGMNISATLSEKEIAKLHAAGPGFYDPARDCVSFLKPFFEDGTVSTPGNGSGAGASGVSGGGSAGTPSDSLTPSASGSPLHHNDMIAKRSAEFHWHHLELYTPTDIEELIAPSRVAEWVLETLKLRRTAAVQSVSTFMNVAKLSTSFFSTSLQLSTTEQLTHLMRKSYLDRLRTEVLSWKTTFPEFASLLLQAVTPRGGAKVLHRHPCTQRVFDILMSCVLRSGAPLGSEGVTAAMLPRALATSEGVTAAMLPRALATSEGMIAQTTTTTFVSMPSGVTATRHPSSSASGLTSPTSSPRGDSTTEANATNIILRELSDCLVVSENRDMFQEDPERFQSILNVSLHLPKECIKSVVILIEKLCRSEAELRRVLLFLFTPSSVSPTADTAKVRVLRMLFDIAQEDDAMCEMVQECFKGRGITLMLLLVNGERHSSEAIRVLALGLLSLLMPLRSCTKFFKKNDGFDMLSLALTEPRNNIPLGIRTFDALFQIAFDEFRCHREKKPEPDSIAARLMASAPFIHRQKQRDTPSSSSAAAAASSAFAPGAASHLAQLRVQRRVNDFLGHTPSITVSQLGTRRGYSFEHTHDYGRVSEDFGELALLHKGSRYHSLHLPLALKTVLCALDYLIRVLVHRLSVSPAPLAITSPLQGGGGASTFSASTPAEHRTPSGEFPASSMQRQESGPVSSYTRAAPLDGEHVVVEVLNYLDKVMEWPKHALKVMDIPWLAGLWAAVRVFFERPAELCGTLSASPVQAHEPAPMPPSAAAAAWGAGALQPSEAAVRRLHQERGDFVADVTQRSRTVIQKMVILDISVNERAQIRAIRDGEHPPRLVRIVLEEVARHFAVQKHGELLENAGNIIRNLNSLFKDVHTALHPFPPTLGLAIVLAITNISVSSSMQVRRRMKNSSNLLTIRDNLAFYVLRESRRFLRLRKRSLNQLIDLNLGNTHAATVLLFHLSNSIKENNANEVELLVTLVRQMTASDSVRMRELHALMGDSKNVRPLRELLTGPGNAAGSGSVSSGRSPLLPAVYNSHPSPSDRTMSEGFTDLDSNAGGTPWGVSHAGGANPLEEDGPELSPGAYTVQLLDWCRLNRETWAGVQRAVAAALASAGLDKRDEKGHHQAQLQLQQQQQPLTACASPKAASGSGASVGLSDRSRREFQQLRDEFESELAKSALDAK